MELHALLDRLEAFVRLNGIDPLESTKQEIIAIQRGFRELDRTKCSVDDLVSLKFRMQHWRQRAFDLALAALERQPTTARIYELLCELQFKPRAKARDRIFALASGRPEVRDAAARYFAFLGEGEKVSRLLGVSSELERLAGPRKAMPIPPNDPCRCTFEKWAREEDLGRYELSGDGVRYRGIEFRPGDALICSINRDGNGIYTATCAPRGYAYHLGIFAMLEYEGRRIPAVLETYRLGVRPVPLSTFLAEPFSTYVEVYRPRNVSESFHSRLNREAALLPTQVKGYNFDTEDPSHDYLACTSVATALYERAGAPRVRTKSGYRQEPQIQENLGALDFVLPAFLSLTDFINDENMAMVGAVDNGFFDRNVAREICERQFVEIMNRYRLELRKLSVMFHLNLFGVRQMRSGSVIGKLIGMPYGFTMENLPRGPEKVLAVIEIWEHAIAKAVAKSDALIQSRWDHGKLIDVDELNRDPAIVEQVQTKLSGIRCSFVEVESAIATT